MPKAKEATPKTLIQVEVPTPMAGALNLVARQKDVTRSWLVRSILAEYLELKFGPNLRLAVEKWQQYGDGIMEQFLQQVVPQLAKTNPTPTQEIAPIPPSVPQAPPPVDVSTMTPLIGDRNDNPELIKEKGLEAPEVKDDGGAMPEHWPARYSWE